MSFNKSNLGTKIQDCMNAITSSSCPENFLALSAARNQFCSNFKVSVATTNDLPDIFGDKIPNGQVIFVEDIESLVMASNCCWIGVDRRCLRADLAEGRLYTWGSGLTSGNGSTTARSSPGTISGGGTNWCQIGTSVSPYHNGGIKTDGTLWTWGCNLLGQIGDGTTVNKSSPVTTAGGGTNWRQFTIGYQHSHGIKTDGTLWSWGTGCCGALGDGSTIARSSPVTVAGGGTTWCQVSAGHQHSVAVQTDGTLRTWGRDNYLGALGIGSFTGCRTVPSGVSGGGTNWCQGKAGFQFTLGLKTDGTLWGWGNNNAPSSLGLGPDFTNKCSPTVLASGTTGWCQISGSCLGASAVKTNGTLWTWGLNIWGQLGDGTSTSRTSPGTTAGGGTNWLRAERGKSHSLGIKTDGTLWTWGANFTGTLGEGTTNARCSPGTTAGGGTNWIGIGTNDSASFAIELV